MRSLELFWPVSILAKNLGDVLARGLSIKMCDAKKQLSTAKPLVKGFNFFKSGYVLSIKCQKLNDHFYVKSQVLPSMKKSKLYSCFIVMDALGQVVKAYDGCPAGIDGRCNHVAATLFALEQYFKFRQQEQTQYLVHQNYANGIFHVSARLMMYQFLTASLQNTCMARLKLKRNPLPVSPHTHKEHQLSMSS